jgi:hypothetical protein
MVLDCLLTYNLYSSIYIIKAHAIHSIRYCILTTVTAQLGPNSAEGSKSWVRPTAW